MYSLLIRSIGGNLDLELVSEVGVGNEAVMED